MKKLLTLLIIASTSAFSCKKEEGNKRVPIDMTLNTYHADAKFGNYPYYDVKLQLKFQSDGSVILRVPPFEESVKLKYEIGDKNSDKTTLHIFGELDKSLYAHDFVKGAVIDWNTEIGKLSYNADISGFTVGKYRFTSY